MFTVIFTPAARAELIDAQDWYEAEASGLGRRFRHAIDALAERMSANPRQFPVVFENVRRALLAPLSLRAVFCRRRRNLTYHCLFSCQPRPLAMAKANLKGKFQQTVTPAKG